MTADPQQYPVYAWEEREVRPLAPWPVVFDEAQRLVDGIWADLGLAFPPRVVRQPAQSRRTEAQASRLHVWLPPRVAVFVLLHELAHALTSHVDEAPGCPREGHGPVFVGLYVELLVRYLRLDRGRLLDSLRAAGIGCADDAKPVFLDGEAG